MSPRLQALSTYALKWRHASSKITTCGEAAPPIIGVQRRMECFLPLYHRGALHRTKRNCRNKAYVWAAGDVAPRLARGRAPKVKKTCGTVPGVYCFTHRVRHHMPRRRS